MTVEEYISKLDRRLAELHDPALISGAVNNVHTAQLNRIFDTGVKAIGPIGAYSTKPMYADAKQFSNAAAFTGMGKPRVQNARTGTKNGKSNNTAGYFKNGKPHKSMYLQNGYRQLKSVQGLQASFVNLSYTTALRNDIAQSLTGTGQEYISGVSNTANAQKLNGLLEKYGNDLFALTEEEKNTFSVSVGKKINSIINGGR